jgi:hypothetical protein
VLQRSRVVSVVGELVSTGVPQHVGVDTKRHLGGLTEPPDEPMNAAENPERVPAPDRPS